MSAEYRNQTVKKKGEKIWMDMEYKLPPAEGITNLDRVRLRMFERLVKELPKEKRVALYAWLLSKVRYCENNFTEHTTGKIEEAENRHWQIYESHLEVVYKWI